MVYMQYPHELEIKFFLFTKNEKFAKWATGGSENCRKLAVVQGCLVKVNPGSIWYSRFQFLLMTSVVNWQDSGITILSAKVQVPFKLAIWLLRDKHCVSLIK